MDVLISVVAVNTWGKDCFGWRGLHDVAIRGVDRRRKEELVQTRDRELWNRVPPYCRGAEGIARVLREPSVYLAACTSLKRCLRNDSLR